jgi:hypothetical protein
VPEINIYVAGFQMRALRKSSGEVEIKMQHGRFLTENAARHWNLLMVSSLSHTHRLSLSLSSVCSQLRTYSLIKYFVSNNYACVSQFDMIELMLFFLFSYNGKIKTIKSSKV